MGIRFHCPNGHKINVKAFLAGKRALCPTCGAKVVVPYESEGATSLASAVDGLRSGDAATRTTLPEAAISPAPNAAITATPSPLAKAESKPVTAASPVAAEVTSPEAKAASPTFSTPAASTASTASTAPAGSVVQPAAFPIAAPPAPLSDPIAEAPHAVWYVRPRAGGQFGPAPGDVFRQWITERRVAADSLVWRDGWTDWRLAGDVLPHFAAVAPPSLFAGVAAPTATFSLPALGLPAGPSTSAAGFSSAGLPGAGLGGAALPSVAPVAAPLAAAKTGIAPVATVAMSTAAAGSTASATAATPAPAVRGRRSWINSLWVVGALAVVTIGLVVLLFVLVSRMP